MILIFFPQVTDFLMGSKAVACKMKLVPLQTSFSHAQVLQQHLSAVSSHSLTLLFTRKRTACQIQIFLVPHTTVSQPKELNLLRENQPLTARIL